MLVFSKIEPLKNHLESISKSSTTGFVPTMGALHMGHLSLVKKAKKENEFAMASIFVNPTQFDKKGDLEKYPKSVELDLEKLKEGGCDLVFKPSVEEIYQGNIASESFDFGGLEKPMEGKFRKGHFEGVGTIVRRLFEIFEPNRAYFGEKDFQQLLIIKKMADVLKLPVEVIGCPIYREEDGLAMSSRNLRLSENQRKAAPFIYKMLLRAKEKLKTSTPDEVKKWFEHEFKNESKLRLEYFEIADAKTLENINEKGSATQARAFVAAFVGKVRLIDNIALEF